MNKIILSIVIILSGVFLVSSITSSVQENATFDESAHISSGYLYWRTGNFGMNSLYHPPLANLMEGLPLLFLKLKLPSDPAIYRNEQLWRLGDEFLYHNIQKEDTILFWARLPVIILSLGLGILVFIWTKELYGIYPALFSFSLYVFCPNILTHSHLATTDLPISFFTFLSIFLFWKYCSSPSIVLALLTGTATGLALATKFSSISLFIILGLLYVIFSSRLTLLRSTSYEGQAPTATKTQKTKISFLLFSAIFFGSILLFLSLCYGFSSFDAYFKGLKNVLSTDIVSGGRAAFMWGKTYIGRNLLYFPFAFLVKTPVPLLIFLLIKCILTLRTVIANFNWRKNNADIKSATTKNFLQSQAYAEIFLLLPVILFLAIACTGRINIGLRHILPIYPFLFVWVGEIVSFLPKAVSGKNRIKSISYSLVFFLLVLWYILSSLRIYPYYIVYFNEFTGGPKNGYKYLADSNLDWGQDLKRLGEYLKKENIEKIYFSYFGTADPSYYGIKYVNIGFISSVERQDTAPADFSKDKRIILAVSATNLVATYYVNKDVFSWLKKYKPIKTIGYSIFVYDLTNEQEGLERLRELKRN